MTNKRGGMDVKTMIYRVRSWMKHQLRARNTGGHGVHSPYLFEWVRMVMMDKNSYYAWGKIEAIRNKMLQDERVIEFVDYGSASRSMEKGSKDACGLSASHNAKNMIGGCAGQRDERRVCDIAKGSLAKKKYAQMLARLVNWLGRPLQISHSKEGVGEGLTIVELGTSLGVTTAYMASVDSRNRVVTYEGCPAVAEIAKENWNALGISNIECRVGEIDVDRMGEELGQVDVAFVDANHTYAGIRAYVNILLQKMHAKSVLVVDDIHYNADMERAWREICEDERVTSTMDLYQMGLVFFDEHYWKRHYVMKL